MRQDQAVETGGQAVQAGRDVVIHHSAMSPEQMTQIMIAMAKQLDVYHQDAKKTLEDRFTSFREEILKRFSEDKKANPEAFKDPDFQFVLRDAQESFARSGDKAVRDTLVDIIARRSVETDRNRLAMALNDAAKTAPSLTANEFSELSLVYILRYTRRYGIIDFPSFVLYIKNDIMPFLADVSSKNSSYLHLEAQGCGKIEITKIKIVDIFRQNYAGVLGKGFDRAQLEAHLGPNKETALDGAHAGNPYIIRCVNDPSKLQPNALSRAEFLEHAKLTGLPPDLIENVWNLFESTMMNEEELIAKMSPHVPQIAELFRVWQSAPLGSFSLNTVGMAIAHANAVRVTNFDASLDIWIN